MAESLSLAITAVSLAKFAMVGYGEVRRYAVYRRYNNGLYSVIVMQKIILSGVS
jgi:hypothetical protein